MVSVRCGVGKLLQTSNAAHGGEDSLVRLDAKLPRVRGWGEGWRARDEADKEMEDRGEGVRDEGGSRAH